MKTNQLMSLAAILFCCQLSFSQGETNLIWWRLPDVNPVDKSLPNFILQVDDQTLDIGSGMLGKVKVNSILVEWISSMQVSKGEAAIAKYGEKGKDGVILITIKEMDLLPKEIQDAFKAAKKE